MGAEEREAAERIGTVLLGKWRLDSLLGIGGMAAVYAATHRNGARGALKILHSSEADDIRDRFVREGYIANHVEHPSVVRVLDDDVAEDGSAFLVMELLEGKSLDALAREYGGKLSAAEVLHVTDEILDALAAAHDRGIIHRDIKPENVFLTTSGDVKILDFGIARIAEYSMSPTSSSTQTRAGVAMGTPTFMSPEQARGRWDLVGVQSDIWSVGATMFTLLTGEFVHLEETVPELLAAVFMKQARSLREAMPNAPQALVAIVDRALQLHMADRWGSAREMQQALRNARAEILDADVRPLPLVRRRLARGLPHMPAPRTAALITLGVCALTLLVAAGAHGVDAKALPRMQSVAQAPHGFAAAPVASSGSPSSGFDTEQDTATGSEEASRAPVAARAEALPAPAAKSAASAPASSAIASPKGVGSSAVGPRRNIYDRRY